MAFHPIRLSPAASKRNINCFDGKPVFLRVPEIDVNAFDKKWLQGGAARDEAFIGSGDIQSLADLNNSFETIPAMQVFPFGKGTVLQIAAAALLPVLLSLISLGDLVKRLIGILL